MKYSAKIEVRFRKGLFDPEGEATKKSLQSLRFPVEGVKLSKVYNLIFDANSKDDAHAKAEEMCKKLLANPNKDDYAITIEEIK